MAENKGKSGITSPVPPAHLTVVDQLFAGQGQPGDNTSSPQQSRPRAQTGDRKPSTPAQPAGAGPAAGPAVEQGRKIEARHSLGDRLKQTQRHPVLIFGARQTGKTTFLMSLLQRVRRSEKMSWTQGDPIIPSGHESYASIQDETTNFLEWRVREFAMNHPVPRTDFDFPFFLPINLKRADIAGDIKFALLEGKGEFYEPNEAGDQGRGGQRFYKDLLPDVASVLRTYTESISMVYVAPYHGDSETERAKAAQDDLGLVGAIEAYAKHRGPVDQDRHLFLLTKWDLHANPERTGSKFSQVFPEDAEKVIQNIYPQAWRALCSLQGAKFRRYYMQYSSGFIVGDEVRTPAARHGAAFDRYPSTVWNWLHRNAVESGANSGPQPPGWNKPLFPEALSTGKTSLWQRLLALFGRR